MKKIIALLLAAIMMVGVLTGCNLSKKNQTDPTEDLNTAPKTDSTDGADNDETNDTTSSEESNENEMNMTDICATLYSIIETKPMQFSTVVADVDLTAKEGATAYTGLDNLDDVKAAAVCEAVMGVEAFSVVLVQVKDAAKVEEIAQKMQDGINPSKWVQVEADDLKVATAGDLILLAMMDSEYAADCTSQDMVDAFLAKYEELNNAVG